MRIVVVLCSSKDKRRRIATAALPF
ncbi:uncharacterized protein G2W53_025037 [Senna tora]|uniref:Uncharacterized protein n=1 Tax=Senna tora TaxID=362788 RepID=A0A834TCH1_9FABA|nr:uncharacterized protein G2W53_025037 [Senna tora]